MSADGVVVFSVSPSFKGCLELNKIKYSVCADPSPEVGILCMCLHPLDDTPDHDAGRLLSRC